MVSFYYLLKILLYWIHILYTGIKFQMAAVWQSPSWNRQMNLMVNFTDVFKSEHTQVPLPNGLAPFKEDTHVSAEGVTKLFKGLNPFKSFRT